MLNHWNRKWQRNSVFITALYFFHFQNFTVKNPGNSNSSLAKKRRNKTAANNAIPSTIDEQISTEWFRQKRYRQKSATRKIFDEIWFSQKKKIFTKKLNVEYRNSSCNVDQRFVFEALEKCYNFFSSLFHNLSFLWRHDDLQKNAVIRGIVLLLSLPTIVGSASPPI